MHDYTADILYFSVVSKRPLEKTSLFAKLSNSLAVIMSEHLIAENSLSNLRSIHEIDLQKPSLKSTFFGLVILEYI